MWEVFWLLKKLAFCNTFYTGRSICKEIPSHYICRNCFTKMKGTSWWWFWSVSYRLGPGKQLGIFRNFHILVLPGNQGGKRLVFADTICNVLYTLKFIFYYLLLPSGTTSHFYLKIKFLSSFLLKVFLSF